MLPVIGLAGTLISIAVAFPTQPQVVLVGTVRQAVSREPLASATIQLDVAGTAITDSTGRFVLRVSSEARWFGVQKLGFLDFQFPLLQLASDTVTIDIELRTNPPEPSSYSTKGILPYLCVMVERSRLDVTNSCKAFRRPQGEYQKKIIKHNPWNPYFGAAGDRGGVLLATRSG